MSIHPHAPEYWLKMPTEKLHAALSQEPEDGGNTKVIRAILETRNSAQIAKAMLAMTDSNRVLTQDLAKIAAQNAATSKRLARMTIVVSVAALITIIAAGVALLRK